MAEKLFFSEAPDGTRTRVGLEKAMELQFSPDHIVTVDSGMMKVFKQRRPSFFPPMERLRYGGGNFFANVAT